MLVDIRKETVGFRKGLWSKTCAKVKVSTCQGANRVSQVYVVKQGAEPTGSKIR